MTDLITAEDVERILNLLRSETEAASRTDAADMIEALHAELTQAHADAEAAVALALEEADLAVQAVSDNCETDGERLAIMSAVDRVRALATASGVAKLAALRERAEKAEADMRVWMLTAQLADQRATDLTAELAAANAREAGLRALLINRDGGSHDEDCKARRYANSDGLCNCGHDEVVAALAQFSTGGGA